MISTVVCDSKIIVCTYYFIKIRFNFNKKIVCNSYDQFILSKSSKEGKIKYTFSNVLPNAYTFKAAQIIIFQTN